MAITKQCPQCGTSLGPDAPAGLCPNCLLGRGLQSPPLGPEGGSDALASPTTAAGPRFVPPAPESLAPHFPQLDIIALVGHGGMGAVYQARQRKLDRLIALKIIRPESADDPAFAVRFDREARTLARLNHPNIVTIYDFGEVTLHDPSTKRTRTLYYFLMEFVDGTNLRNLMTTEQLTPEQALSIVPQVCEALQLAHDEGIVHRDIKPENILLDRKGRVKITDFGLAKLAFHHTDDFTLTATHQIVGTPRYMAPEQMEGAHSVDHRADIYSLGVVFYEMLTGQVPAGHFQPPSKKVPVDARLDEIVLRSLAREPERRYQQASHVKTDVETIGRMPSPEPVRTVPPAKPIIGSGSEKPFPVPTMLTCLTVFLAVFLPWNSLDPGMTGKVTSIHLGSIAIPNWLLAVVAVTVGTLVTLEYLRWYMATMLIPALCVYGLLHLVVAAIQMAHVSNAAPGFGIFVGLAAFAGLLISRMGRRFVLPAKLAAGYGGLMLLNVTAATMIWQFHRFLMLNLKLSFEMLGMFYLPYTLLVSGVFWLLFSLIPPLHALASKFVRHLHDAEAGLVSRVLWIAAMVVLLIAPPAIATVLSHDSIFGPPIPRVHLFDMTFMAIVAGVLSIASGSMTYLLMRLAAQRRMIASQWESSQQDYVPPGSRGRNDE